MSRATDEYRRQMGMDMLAGACYDMAEQTFSTSAEVICQPGGEAYGFVNYFSCPVRLLVRNGEIQSYELLWDAE